MLSVKYEATDRRGLDLLPAGASYLKGRESGLDLLLLTLGQKVYFPARLTIPLSTI